MDRFKCMQAFVVVADASSVSAAAETLCVSKSVVSLRVSQLEELVGAKLLERSSRRVRLTERGAMVYPSYAALVAQLSDIENSVLASDGQLRGPLRLASMIDIGSSEIAAATSQFMARHPELEIDLILSDSFVNPSEHGFDVTFHYRALNNDNLVQDRVAEIQCGLYASPSYVEQFGEPESPEDIAAHTCLGYAQQEGVYDWNSGMWLFGKDGKQIVVETKLNARFNSGQALRQFVVDGNGLAILPNVRAAEFVKNGQLVKLLKEYDYPCLSLYAVYSRASANNMKLKAFLEFLKSDLAERTMTSNYESNVPPSHEDCRLTRS